MKSKKKKKIEVLATASETWFPLDNTINSSFSIQLNFYLRTTEKMWSLQPVFVLGPLLKC